MTPPIPATPSKADYRENPADIEPIFECVNPFALFSRWLADARAAEPNDANAMSVATVDADNLPDVRMVLLKGFDETGFTFYTNENSAKGQQLVGNQSPGHKTSGTAKAALCFHWKSLRRQVRVRGTVEPVTGDAADLYFASRARGSQTGAWASDQSSPLDSRETLEARIREIDARYADKDIPRPAHWYGWRVAPLYIEFWRDRAFRLHDRLAFTRENSEAAWIKTRLYP